MNVDTTPASRPSKPGWKWVPKPSAFFGVFRLDAAGVLRSLVGLKLWGQPITAGMVQNFRLRQEAEHWVEANLNPEHGPVVIVRMECQWVGQPTD